MIRVCLLNIALLLTLFSQAQKHPKNVIFIIGDGMGLAQIHAAMVSNGNKLEMERFRFVGFSKTYSSDNFTTDSGAGGTALACGVKTNNGMVGMGPDSVAVTSILELASKNKLATGIVALCDLTHATPAAFVAHQVSRKMSDEIALDYLKANIDVFIGGGRKNFENRYDQRNLLLELQNQNYTVANNIHEAQSVKTGKLAALLFEGHPPAMPERGNLLSESVDVALNLLRDNKNGFFLMVEGSQIDWAAHENNSEQLVAEMLDLDNTIGRILDFATKNKNTLVIVTADHETGGLTLPTGNMAQNQFNSVFATKSHTGILVPVLAFGPGAAEFTGFMENTTFKNKLVKLLSLEP